MALAYFLTNSTYGTWLSGSEKSSVDQIHNAYGTPFVKPDSEREQRAREVMTQPPYVMNSAEREDVCRAMLELAKERGWDILATHVRSYHVHVVVAAEREPGRLISDLKGRASRELTIAGFGSNERKRWTRHGSTRHLFRDEEIEAAIRYLLDEQGERMSWYLRDLHQPR